MPAGPQPIRDAIIALAVGGVLALLVMVGVRLSPGAEPLPAAPSPMQTPRDTPDACMLRDSGGAGGGYEPDPVPGPNFPRQDHQLATGSPVVVRGSGNAEVGYERLSEFATVVTFACETCSGPLQVFNTGAALPIIDGEAGGEPIDVEWLIDTVHELTDGPHNSLLVDADGDWTLTLRSWHDLPVRTGAVSGQGSQVVRVDSGDVRVSFAPLNSRDTLNVYAYRFSDRSFTASTCIGRFESRTIDLNGGEVLLVWARGEWTLDVG